MFSRRRTRHTRGMTDVSSASMSIPDVTGDATARYENNSHGGSTWYDLMPTPANGTDGGTVTWPEFDGGGWVVVGQPAKLDFAGAFTVSFWVKQDPVAPPPGTERVVARDNPGAGHRCYVANEVDTTGQFAGFLWGAGMPPPGYTSATTGVNPTNNWYYATYLNEGAAGDLAIFINGEEQARTAAGGGVMIVHPVDLYFGRDAGASSTFQGELDTVRFYSRALSADEILRDYQAGLTAHQ